MCKANLDDFFFAAYRNFMEKASPTSKSKAKAPAMSKEDRLKAALKANMARRKEQSKARQASGTAAPDDGSKG